LLKPGSATSILLKERGIVMDSTMIIRIAAGVLVVVGIVILVLRRRGKIN
jgi:nitrate reductase gamma subunit